MKTIYENTFTYDANGNILYQLRRNSSNVRIDDLEYTYDADRNRLRRVEDLSVSYSEFSDDIDLSRYTYDEEGRLKTDSQEGIADIVWRVDGKVKAIVRDGVVPKQKNLIFDYDAMGHRIAKHVYDENFQLQKSTYYILDASGNVMATYDKEINYAESTTYFKLKERHIYGSSRVGVRNSDLDVLPLPDKDFSMTTVHYSIGSRTYELSNHLNNVLTVISDKVIPHSSGSGGVDYFLADIRQTFDYSPFHAPLTDRTLSKTGYTKDYRYGGSNGQEKTDEVAGKGNHYTAEFWEYDPRSARRWNRDPLVKHHESPYACYANNPIWFKDPNGADTLNGNTVLPDVKSLNQRESEINKAKSIIEGQVAERDRILEQINSIENQQDLSELLIDFNPFKSNPLTGPVKAHVEGNENAIILLKAEFLRMEFIINEDIISLNKMIESYNYDLFKMDLALKSLDSDDNLFIGGKPNSVYLEQNKDPNRRALFRLEVQGKAYRFGTVKEKETKSLIVKLDYIQVMEVMRPSFELLGISAEDAFKALPETEKANEKIKNSFKKFFK